MQIEQDSNCRGDECVDAGSVNVAQVGQEADSHDRAGDAAHGEGNNDWAFNCSFAQMDGAGSDLGKEVEEGVRTDRDDGRDLNDEDEQREQKNAAADSRHSDQSAYPEANQDFEQQFHDVFVKSSRLCAGTKQGFVPTPIKLGLVRPDEAFALQVQDNFLRRFFRAQVGGVDDDFRVLGLFVRI